MLNQNKFNTRQGNFYELLDHKKNNCIVELTRVSHSSTGTKIEPPQTNYKSKILDLSEC